MRPCGLRLLPPYSEVGCWHSSPLVTPQIPSTFVSSLQLTNLPLVQQSDTAPSSRAERKSPPLFWTYTSINLIQASSLPTFDGYFFLFDSSDPQASVLVFSWTWTLSVQMWCFHEIVRLILEHCQCGHYMVAMVLTCWWHLGAVSCCWSNGCGLGKYLFLLGTLVSRLSLPVTRREESTVQIREGTSCPCFSRSVPYRPCLSLGVQ